MTTAEPIAGHRICPLCESTCGLLVELDGRAITRVAPNPDDVMSAGHSCAKGLGLGRIEGDPDRIRTPLPAHRGRYIPRGHLGRGVRRDRASATGVRHR